jgi:DNA-directed RNA polymerase specialized sigma24 family protein
VEIDPGPNRRPAPRKGSTSVAVRGSLPASWAELEEFHREFFLPLVWRATYKRGLSKEDAKDVVQEAFVVAMAKLRSDGNPRRWLNRVVDHLCANHQRKVNRRAHLAARWGFAERPGDTDPDGPGEEPSE